METIVILVLIFAGVAFSVYQVYDVYYVQNFGDDEKQAEKEAYDMASTSERLEMNERKLEKIFCREIVAAAMKDSALSRNPEPLLRRKGSVIFDERIKIRYLPFWIAKPITRNWREFFLIIVLVNCLVAMFLGGLSLYTVAYKVPGDTFSWMNNHVVALVLLMIVILLTHGIAKLDVYLHDLYRIGCLNRWFA